MSKPKLKPKTKGGMSIKHAQASIIHNRKVNAAITLPRVSILEKKSSA